MLISLVEAKKLLENADPREYGAVGIAKNASADEIRRLLKSADAEERKAALWALGLSRRAACFSDLAACCDDVDEGVRRQAVYCFKSFNNPDCIPYLEKLSSDSSESVSHAAVQAAAALKCEHIVAKLQDPLAGLGAMLGDPDWRVRKAAAASLAGYDSECSADLARLALNDEDGSVRVDGAASLSKFLRENAVGILVPYLHDDYDSMRSIVLRVIQPYITAEHRDYIADALNDDCRFVREAAIDCAKKLIKDGVDSLVPLVANMMDSDDSKIRREAIIAMAEMFPGDPAIFDKLVGLLYTETDDFALTDAVTAHWMLRNRNCLPGLLHVVRNPKGHISVSRAVAMLKVWVDDEVNERLFEQLELQNKYVISSAADYYISLGLPGSERILIDVMNQCALTSGASFMAGYFLASGNDILIEAANRYISENSWEKWEIWKRMNFSGDKSCGKWGDKTALRGEYGKDSQNS